MKMYYFETFGFFVHQDTTSPPPKKKRLLTENLSFRKINRNFPEVYRNCLSNLGFLRFADMPIFKVVPRAVWFSMKRPKMPFLK